MPDKERIAITGMAISTPLGDKLDEFLENLLQGRSAITRWKFFDSSGIDSKIGGDLTGYDIARKVSSLRRQIPEAVAERLQRLTRSSPWSTKLSVLLAVDAFLDAGLFAGFLDRERISAIVAGHNLNNAYTYGNFRRFAEKPDDIEAALALYCLDSDHAGCVTDGLDIRGPVYTVGGACASGHIAMRCAMDEIRQRHMDVVLVVGAVFDVSPPGATESGHDGGHSRRVLQRQSNHGQPPLRRCEQPLCALPWRRSTGSRGMGARLETESQNLRRVGGSRDKLRSHTDAAAFRGA